MRNIRRNRSGFGALIGAMALIGLIGCDSGNGGTGSLTLEITDAPVHNASEVWVRFTGVTVKPSNGEPIEFSFSTPRDYDLLLLTGDATEVLLDAEGLPAGNYDWISLHVNADFDNEFDSYVLTDTGQMIELRVPSGAQSGLRLVSGFTITANETTRFVIDWDLRKALVQPPGQPGWFLRPALRITDRTEHGIISGRVADALINDDSCSNDIANDLGNAVYLFEGTGVTPADIDGTASDPLTSANVAQNVATGVYEYSLHFLSPGDYTVAFTCQALDDDPEVADDLVFVDATDVTVTHGETTLVDFGF